MVDFILLASSNVYYPGILPYRGRDSSKGYESKALAEVRIRQIRAHAASRGLRVPDLQVRKRIGGAVRRDFPVS